MAKIKYSCFKVEVNHRFPISTTCCRRVEFELVLLYCGVTRKISVLARIPCLWFVIVVIRRNECERSKSWLVVVCTIKMAKIHLICSFRVLRFAGAITRNPKAFLVKHMECWFFRISSPLLPIFYVVQSRLLKEAVSSQFFSRIWRVWSNSIRWWWYKSIISIIPRIVMPNTEQSLIMILYLGLMSVSFSL